MIKFFESVKSRVALPESLEGWLILSSLFSCFLLAIRTIGTGTVEYYFLPWNLFLAFVPYLIMQFVTNNPGIMENKVKLIAALLAWLLFIPNSFYIVTDLFHLSHFDAAPKWYDLLLIFSFAWNGIVFGIASLRKVELVILIHRNKGFSLLIVFTVMWLNSFGIYIGRFLRFNSWDVISSPVTLTSEIFDMILHPLNNSSAWGMTLFYAFFMTFLYFTIKKLGEAFIGR